LVSAHPETRLCERSVAISWCKSDHYYLQWSGLREIAASLRFSQ
ncbi:MAG: hypothetical protein ACI92E_002182, partial [Oceanicoccus sp.]